MEFLVHFVGRKGQLNDKAISVIGNVSKKLLTSHYPIYTEMMT